MPSRALALLPASFFALAAVVNALDGTLFSLVWVCNAMNLLLAASIATRWPRGIWLATLWLLPGVPLWLLDVVAGSSLRPHSFFTHVAAAAVGVTALRRTPHPTGGVWWQAVALAVALQLVARAITPPGENVNLAFAAHASVAAAFPRLADPTWFPVVWAVNVGVFLLLMLLLERALAAFTSPSGSRPTWRARR